MNRVKKFGIYLMFFSSVFYSFAYPLDLNSLYGLTNETPPGVVSLGNGGYFVSGGGFYIHPTPPSSPGNIFTATPPQLNASCGSLDAFLGGIGFGGFSLLVQKFQAILMALPIVAFKIALAILAPQVSTILDNIERITDALNNMQIGQCGQIHGLDVHAITSAIGNIKSALTQHYTTSASQRAKNFYEQISNPSKWNISSAINTWNKYVNDTWQQLSNIFSVNGVSVVNFAQDPSLMRNAIHYEKAEGQLPNSIADNQQVRQFVRALIGDINMNAIGSGSSNAYVITPVQGGKYGGIQQIFDSLVNCGTVPITPFNTHGSEGLDVGSEGTSSGLGLFCYTKFYKRINDLYGDIEQGNQIQPGTSVYNTEQLLASVSYVPALAVIEWGAVVSSADGDTTASDPLARYIDAKLGKALAIEITYAFFSNYINIAVNGMKTLVTAAAKGNIPVGNTGKSTSHAIPVSRAIKSEVVPHMKDIIQRASHVLDELSTWRNNRLQNSGKQLKELAEKSGKLRNEAFSILKGMGLYSTYLKAIGG